MLGPLARLEQLPGVRVVEAGHEPERPRPDDEGRNSHSPAAARQPVAQSVVERLLEPLAALAHHPLEKR